MTTTRKSVLISGASSGIGRASVVQVSRAGWRVFATVRKSADKERLLAEGLPNVSAIIMDVEDQTSIQSAAEQLTSELNGTGLDGLVNVAGIGMIRPAEFATARDIQHIFNVNVFGQIAVTQCLLPLLHKNRGRIVNISSVGAHIAIPFGGLLNASKSALGCFSDTLRLELRPFGIRVITIEPGSIATPAVNKTLGNVEDIIASLPPEARGHYGPMLRNLARRGYQREMSGSPPEVVAQAVHHALTSDRPRIRYRVGKDARLIAALPRLLPDALLDLIRMRALGLPTRFGAAVQSETRESRPAVTIRKTDRGGNFDLDGSRRA